MTVLWDIFLLKWKPALNKLIFLPKGKRRLIFWVQAVGGRVEWSAIIVVVEAVVKFLEIVLDLDREAFEA